MRLRIVFQLLLALLPGLLAALHAAEHLVSPRGDDAAEGSRRRPWKTLRRACQDLKPGDTVVALPGEYHEALAIAASGSREGGSITLRGEPGAVISGAGIKTQNLVLIENRSYIRFSGFELRGLAGVHDGSGIRVTGHGSHIELRGNRIHDIRGKDAMGITIYGTDPARPLENVVVDGNEIFDCDPAKSEALTLNGNVTGFRVTNNQVHDVNNIGIDLIGGERDICPDRDKVVRDGVCEGNKAWRCRSSYGDGYAAGIYVDGGRNIVVENNTVTECDLGLEVGAENKAAVARGIVVRHNLLFHNDKAGLVFGGFEKSAGRVEGCRFLDNICCDNNRHSSDQNGELWIQHASDNEVSGNTFITGLDTPLVQVDEGGTKGNTFHHNRYHGKEGEADALFLWLDQDVNGFAAWQQVSGQDKDSVFGPVEVRLPVLGKR